MNLRRHDRRCGETALDDPGGNLCPRAKSELGEDASHVGRHSVRAQIQVLPDSGVGKSHRQQVRHLLLPGAQRLGRFSSARPRRDTKDAKDTGSRFALAVGGLAISCRRPALPGSPLADVHHHVEQMGDLAIGTAQWVDLPVPARGLASLAPSEDAKLAELEALEVTGLGRAADLAHDVEDAALGSRRKNIGYWLSRARELFRREPVFPDLVGISKVKRLIAVRDVESDRERVEQTAKDDQGVRRRGRLEDRSEASYRRLRLVQVGSPGERSDDFASTNAMLQRAQPTPRLSPPPPPPRMGGGGVRSEVVL